MNYKNLKTFKKLKFNLLNLIKIIIKIFKDIYKDIFYNKKNKILNKIFNLNYTKKRKLNYIYNIPIMIFTN